MGQWVTIIKDVFLVYDQFKESGVRISKEMAFGAVAVLSSILVATGVIPLPFTDAEIMGIGTGVYTLVYMALRLFSKGGRIKLRDDLDPEGAVKSVKPKPEPNGFLDTH